MKKNKTEKSFAFKLATATAAAPQEASKWQARDGVSTAGCSGPDYRADATWPRHGRDQGMWC